MISNSFIINKKVQNRKVNKTQTLKPALFWITIEIFHNNLLNIL